MALESPNPLEETMNRKVGQSQAEKGLIVSVLRDSLGEGDFTRGGLTAHHHELTVVNIDGPFGPRDHRPAVMLIQGSGKGSNPILVPAVEDEAGDWHPAAGWWMAGGNYAVTSDTRFSEALEKLGATRTMAPKVHDRIEAPDIELSTADSSGALVVIGIVRRRGMTWIALDQHGGTLSEHESEAGAVEAIEIAAGVQK
jgi:hypothetical protein